MSTLKYPKKWGKSPHATNEPRGSKYGRTGKTVKKQVPLAYRNIPLTLGFPKSKMMKLRYAGSGTLNVASTPAYHYFWANSLYDPDYTATGHQPMFRDIIANIYNHYVVIGAKCTATFWTEDASTTYASIVGIKLNDDVSTTPIAAAQTLLEQPSGLTRWKHLRHSANSGNNTITKVKHFFSAKKFFGIKDVNDNKQDIGAAVGSSPTDGAYFTLFNGHITDGVDLPQVFFTVIIDYIVKFSELKDIEGS